MSKFFDYVATCPPPNGGRTHGWMLGAANHAAFEKVDVADAERCILDALGTRAMSKRGEVRAALRKAYREREGRPLGRWTSWTKPRPKPKAHDDDIKRMVDGLRYKFGEIKDSDFEWATLYGGPADDGAAAAALVKMLFDDDDLVYAGGKYINDGEILTAREWRERLESGASIPEFIVPNPLTADALVGHDGVKYTVTCKTVRERRWLLAEMDDLPLDTQRTLWWELLHRFDGYVCSLLFTGSRSIHALILVEGDDEAAAVLAELVRWGCDPATGDRVRKTRLPGGVNSKNGRKARLLCLRPPVVDDEGEEADDE